MIIAITVILVSLLFSAFFSGMEIAFVTANRLRIELERQKGTFTAPHIAFFVKRPREYIATMLVGNNIALVVYGIFMGEVLAGYIEVYLHSEVWITLIQTLFSTIVILFTAEYLPKSVFRNNPNGALNLFVLPLRLFYLLLWPLTMFTVWLSNSMLKGLLKVEMDAKHQDLVFGRIDLDNLINEGQATGEDVENSNPEIKLFQNAMEFSEVVVKECMVPRNEVTAVEVGTTVAELERLFAESGFSRIPVYEESTDNMIGYVHHLQMFTKPRNVRSMVKSLPIVPESMSARKLLRKLTSMQRSIATVVDEFGGTAGIVTVEDLLEEIFGEIEDEHDHSEWHEEQISETEFIFSGRLEIDYLNEKYPVSLPEDDDYETLAGYILQHHGRIPSEGEMVYMDQFTFTILKVDNPRIELVKLQIHE